MTAQAGASQGKWAWFGAGNRGTVAIRQQGQRNNSVTVSPRDSTCVVANCDIDTKVVQVSAQRVARCADAWTTLVLPPKADEQACSSALQCEIIVVCACDHKQREQLVTCLSRFN